MGLKHVHMMPYNTIRDNLLLKSKQYLVIQWSSKEFVCYKLYRVNKSLKDE